MNVRALAAYAGLWFAGALMMVLLLFVMLGAMSELGWISEDMIYFNCYFMGNLVCGPEAPWHGFVNLF